LNGVLQIEACTLYTSSHKLAFRIPISIKTG
jgi:hypothetical protein